jgi:hypothetical protein
MESGRGERGVDLAATGWADGFMKPTRVDSWSHQVTQFA